MNEHKHSPSRPPKLYYNCKKYSHLCKRWCPHETDDQISYGNGHKTETTLSKSVSTGTCTCNSPNSVSYKDASYSSIILKYFYMFELRTKHNYRFNRCKLVKHFKIENKIK